MAAEGLLMESGHYHNLFQKCLDEGHLGGLRFFIGFEQGTRFSVKSAFEQKVKKLNGVVINVKFNVDYYVFVGESCSSKEFKRLAATIDIDLEKLYKTKQDPKLQKERELTIQKEKEFARKKKRELIEQMRKELAAQEGLIPQEGLVSQEGLISQEGLVPQEGLSGTIQNEPPNLIENVSINETNTTAENQQYQNINIKVDEKIEVKEEVTTEEPGMDEANNAEYNQQEGVQQNILSDAKQGIKTETQQIVQIGLEQNVQINTQENLDQNITSDPHYHLQIDPLYNIQDDPHFHLKVEPHQNINSGHQQAINQRNNQNDQPIPQVKVETEQKPDSRKTAFSNAQENAYIDDLIDSEPLENFKILSLKEFCSILLYLDSTRLDWHQDRDKCGMIDQIGDKNRVFCVTSYDKRNLFNCMAKQESHIFEQILNMDDLYATYIEVHKLYLDVPNLSSVFLTDSEYQNIIAKKEELEERYEKTMKRKAQKKKEDNIVSEQIPDPYLKISIQYCSICRRYTNEGFYNHLQSEIHHEKESYITNTIHKIDLLNQELINEYNQANPRPGGAPLEPETELEKVDTAEILDFTGSYKNGKYIIDAITTSDGEVISLPALTSLFKKKNNKKLSVGKPKNKAKSCKKFDKVTNLEPSLEQTNKELSDNTEGVLQDNDQGAGKKVYARRKCKSSVKQEENIKDSQL
ncbi:unnamed protein product [Moneuplotes crassus]|uniref:Uncharacterized protein n=1 Tax=Euplotes crassus TaxID=5936 RepID=A0AAD1XU55_EUPCR|nr:unnamed protein product [Moneuplotes crassus]